METKRKHIRAWIIFFMIMLFLSGLTAIPLESELKFLSRCLPYNSPVGIWIDRVLTAIIDTNNNYPYLAYGYDWLAFAHFILAILFIGPLKNPVKNIWVIEFGMIACLLVLPYAFIAGHYRGIPIMWRVIDCSFGLIGLIPLSICYAKIKALEQMETRVHQDWYAWKMEL